MKKILIPLAVIACTVAAASCSHEEAYGTQPLSGGRTAISLSLRSSIPTTKADRDDFSGEDTYNENVIKDFYWFIYSDDAYTDCYASGYVADGTTETINMDEYVETYSKQDGYVFVIANPTETLKESIAALTEPELSELLALEVGEAGFGTLTDGKFTPQERFVMTTEEPVAFTLTDDAPDKVAIELSRVAAKVSIDIKVAKWYTQYVTRNGEVTTEYKSTWYPDVDNMEVSMQYVTDKGTVNAGPATYTVADFFSYDRSAWKVTGKDEDATYEDYAGESDEDGNPKKYTVLATEVTGTPFYTYPISWSNDDNYAPFIKVILPWSSYNEKDNGTIADMKTGTPGSKTDWLQDQEFFYKITLPEVTTLERNHWYHITLELSVLGSRTDDAEVTVTGSYYVTDWSDPTSAMGGDLNAGRYLSTAKSAYDMYDSYVDIPVISSHAITVTNVSSTYRTYATAAGGEASLTYQAYYDTLTESMYTGSNFTIVPYGFESVRVYHTMVSNITDSSFGAKDIAPITYTFRIQQSGDLGASYYKDVTVTQYPPIYVQTVASQSSSIFVNSSSSGSPTNNNGFALGQVGSTGGGGVMTIVTVSTLAGLDTKSYTDNGIGIPVIGDPRVRLGDNYPSYPYYSGGTYTTQSWLNNDLGAAANSYIADYRYAGLDRANFIAPKIMVASSYGANQGKGTCKTNAERCAAYQEYGYPAGRWRLPTEAEILFISTLESKGYVPSIFQGGSGYWANTGRYYDSSNDDMRNDTSNSRSVRCVYDLWYWGDDKLSSLTTWGNFQTDYINQ